MLAVAGAAPARAQGGGRAPTLDTVRVSVAARTGEAARATRSATVITRADIARTAARSIDDVLALALGADVRARSLASADVALRGASSEGVVVLVDGVRVSDQQSGHFDLDLAVPLESVERIEILRGTQSALLGADAVGGVINIVTRSPGASGSSSGEASGGSFGTASVALAGARSAGATRLTGAIDGARSDGHRPGTDYRVSQARGSAARQLAAGTLRLDAGVGVRHFGAADFYGPYPSFEDTRSATASARWDGAVAPAWSLSLGASTRRHGDLFTLERDDPAFYQNRHVSWQSGGELVVRHAVADALSFAAGADYDDLRLRSARLGDRDLRRGAVFSEATIGRAGGAVADAGVRVDRATVEGTFASPTLALALPLGDRTTLRLSGAGGYRAPTWTERYYSDPANVGNPDLRVERFWSAEGGVRVAIAPRALVDVALFARDARDLIDWAKPVGADATTPWRTMNVDRAHFVGFEGEATVRSLAAADWRLRVTGLRFDAASAAGLTGKYALSPITRSTGLSVTWPTRLARLGVDATVERRAAEDVHSIVNARMAVPVVPRRGVELRLDLLNLTDASYRDVSGAPVAGRAGYLALRWSRS